MGKIVFCYDNYWDDYALTETTQHENFPSENTQHRDFNKAWRSQYGAGSGWGYFVVIDSGTYQNNKIDFEDNGTTTRTAILVAGVYDADTLKAHVETQMEATTTDTFTVEYLESSNKFKITNDTGTFKLEWNTGTHKATSAAGLLGYDDSADDTGADNYTADYIRTHTYEYLKQDMGAQKNIYAVIIKGHNIQSSATRWFQVSDNDVSYDTYNFDHQADLLVLYWSTPKNKRYARPRFWDEDNPDLYLKMGRVYVGGQFAPTENFLHEGEIQRIDPSVVMESADGQESSLQQESFDTWTYTFRVKGSTQKGYFDTMFDVVGTSKALFIIEDSASPLTTTSYVRFTGWKWTPIRRDINLWYLSIGVKEQR